MNKWTEGIMGVVIGDALGVPVEFVGREELKMSPVKEMRGYGTYNMPPGTWSDDSSMTLATLTSIKEMGRIDCDDIMKRFVDWYKNGAYTTNGFVFDVGHTCQQAINRYARSHTNKELTNLTSLWNVINGTQKEYSYKDCGCKDERSNGNGSLMRIMPACLYVYEQVKNNVISENEGIEIIHEVSALTHAHLRSQIACGLYYFMIKAILDEKGILISKLQTGMDDAISFYRKDISNYLELLRYERLFKLDEFEKTPDNEIKSSGYVVDSLEAAVWSLITTESFTEGLLKAVNLGSDTDTIAAIAGGLAALHYGYDNIQEDWKKIIIKYEDILALCESMEV